MVFFLVISIFLSNTFIQAIPSASFFYPKTLSVSTCTDNHSWTKWFNTYTPKTGQDFDQELLSTIQTNYGKDICPKHQGVQAQTITTLKTDVSYAVSWKAIDGFITGFISRTPGADFQVRFCCPNSDFQPTTTTTSRPIISKTCGRQEIQPSLKSTRIFGGSRAIPHSWPWQVLYEEQKQCETNRICVDTCGGTLLNTHHVLTAAHCIKGKDLQQIRITAGVHNRQNDESDTRQQRTIDRIFLHPDWNSETLANDLAILQLSQPVEFNKYVQPACLPGPDPQYNSNVILIGWGAEELGGNPYNELKQAQVKVLDQCQKYWNLFDEDNQICVGQTISGDSACQGDSGGPLLQEYNGQWIVQGVASFIDDCKTNGDVPPNVYVKVSSYLNWINTIIN